MIKRLVDSKKALIFATYIEKCFSDLIISTSGRVVRQVPKCVMGGYMFYFSLKVAICIFFVLHL